MLDWFGDVGGLYEGLYRLFNFIVALFYYRALEHFLIENLFLKRKRPETERESSSNGLVETL